MSIDVLPEAGTRSLSDVVADEIRLMLTRRRMSQADLARQLHVSGTWVSYRLNGKQPIDLEDLAAIARVLGVKPSALLATVALLSPTTRRPHRPPNRQDQTRPERTIMLRRPRP